MFYFSHLKKVGDSYHDFLVTKVNLLKELNCTLIELEHIPTGAQIMHIANDDVENLFCLSFRTLPHNSNGVAHILEHTVLCGSRRFPIKDPFFSMSRRSLNTFMNALTGSDFTCYPAASQVKQDFYNLLDVYLDAVFHPELKEMSFLQEGHRLEFNEKGELTFKGIVYNEMKGSLASRDNRLIQKMMQTLFPDLPYAYNSGGDPQEIPLLTYADLIAFHETYYHPSRCLFFFYGNLPLQEHLDFLAEKAFKGVVKAEPIPPLPKQPRFSKPVYVEDRFPIDKEEETVEKSMLSFGWLTTALTDQQTLLALSVLDSILMDTDASLLKKALLQSNLCIQATAYIDTEISEAPYLIICRGCEKENADALEKLLFSTLTTIASEGIPHSLVEAAIHQLELSRLEIVGDHAPFGLTLFMRSALAKQHLCPPENALIIYSLFEELLQKVKDPSYLPSLIQTYLLNNPHFVRLVMKPDSQLALEEAEEEKKRLIKIQQGLSQREKEGIVEQTKKLKTYQMLSDMQSLNCLPQINIEEIPKKTRSFPLTHKKYHHLDVFHHDCFTNHILYADLVFDLTHIEEEEIPLLQLFVTLLTGLGSGSRDYIENLSYIHAHTGGIGASTALYVQANNPLQMRPCLTIRGKSLHQKADKLFELLKTFATSLRLDETFRIKELIQQLDSSLQNRLTHNALRYAIKLSLSGFSLSGHISENWSGIKYYQIIRNLTQDLENNLNRVIEKFSSLKERLFCVENPHLVLGCDLETFTSLEKNHFYGFAELPHKATSLWAPNYAMTPVTSQARSIASSVACSALSFKTASYLHPHAPALALSTCLMDHKILHPHVRERGGAYGVGAHFAPMLGQFYFHSYRDPHIAKTWEAFEEAIDRFSSGHIDKEELNEAKLTMVQQLDAPIPPSNRALAAYSWWREGKTEEMRQNYRDRLLALTPQEILPAVGEQLYQQKEKGVFVTLAEEAMLREENKRLSEKKKSLPILPIQSEKLPTKK